MMSKQQSTTSSEVLGEGGGALWVISVEYTGKMILYMETLFKQQNCNSATFKIWEGAIRNCLWRASS